MDQAASIVSTAIPRSTISTQTAPLGLELGTHRFHECRSPLLDLYTSRCVLPGARVAPGKTPIHGENMKETSGVYIPSCRGSRSLVDHGSPTGSPDSGLGAGVLASTVSFTIIIILSPSG